MRKSSIKAINLANTPWNDQPQGGDVLISSFLQPHIGEQGQKVSLDNSILVSHSGRGAGFPEVGHYVQIVSFQFRKAKETDSTCSGIFFILPSESTFHLLVSGRQGHGQRRVTASQTFLPQTIFHR